MHDGESVLRLNDGSLLSLFQIVGACLSLYAVGIICGPASGFRSPFSSSFFTMIFIICVAMIFHR